MAYLAQFIAGTLVSFLQLLLLGFCAGAWTHKTFRSQPLYVRATAGAVAAYWLLAALFFLLIPFGLFTRTSTTACLAALAILTNYVCAKPRLNIGAFLNSSLHMCVAFWKSMSMYHRILAAAVLLTLCIRLGRGIITPPLAWDALTYHLLKAGRWVQTGGWVWDSAPDIWQYYEWFPPLGDAYWAWAMLGTHTDAWINLAAVMILGTIALAIYSLARELKAERPAAMLTVLAAVSVPACLALLTAAYVDNTAYALVALGSSLTASGIRRKSTSLTGTGLTAFALAVGIKITFLPYLLIGFAVTALLVFLHRTGKSALIIAGVVCIALSWQVFLVYDGKTPFYPVPLSIGDISIEPGQPEFMAMHFPKHSMMPYRQELPISIKYFLRYVEPASPQHLNLTWFFPVLLLSGSVGLLLRIRKVPSLLIITISAFFAAGLVLFLQFWTPRTEFYRLVFFNNMGRFFLPFYGLVCILTLLLPGRIATGILASAIAINTFETWPRAWKPLDWTNVVPGIAIVAGLILCLCAITKRKLILLVPVALPAIVAGLWVLRTEARYEYYKNTPLYYDVFTMGKTFPGTITEFLDNEKPSTIAFSSPYMKSSYRWFRYILMGSKLQNKVVYITPTADGSTWSRSVIREKPTDPIAWKLRLKQAGVNYLVVLNNPLEQTWAIDDPSTFQYITKELNSKVVLYQIKYD